MKTCAKCSESKPFDQFYKRSSAKDGHASYCKECQRLYLQAWKQDNPDKVSDGHKRDYRQHKEKRLAYNAKWRAENKESHYAAIRRWGKDNPERRAAMYRRYRERNPEKFKRWQDERRDSGRRRISNMVRRALVANATIKGAELTDAVLYGRFAVHGWRCYYCGLELTPKTVEADHRIPLSRGGLNCGANIVPCCRSCNVRKSDRTETEYKSLAVKVGKKGGPVDVQ